MKGQIIYKMNGVHWVEGWAFGFRDPKFCFFDLNKAVLKVYFRFAPTFANRCFRNTQ